MSPSPLDRLAITLDALDIDVPIGIWSAGSHSPPSPVGYLPDTGLLTELTKAAQHGEMGRTLLLVMRALGPQGPAGTHVLALGDAVKALKRIGLEADARRLALEALLPAWPRATAH